MSTSQATTPPESLGSPLGSARGGRIDLRTREGRRSEILDQIREYGGVSIFWITENALRARIAMDMQNSGEIETWNDLRGFPWISAAITRQASRRRSNRQPESTGEPSGRSGVGSKFRQNVQAEPQAPQSNL